MPSHGFASYGTAKTLKLQAKVALDPMTGNQQVRLRPGPSASFCAIDLARIGQAAAGRPRRRRRPEAAADPSSPKPGGAPPYTSGRAHTDPHSGIRLRPNQEGGWLGEGAANPREGEHGVRGAI